MVRVSSQNFSIVGSSHAGSNYFLRQKKCQSTIIVTRAKNVDLIFQFQKRKKNVYRRFLLWWHKTLMLNFCCVNEKDRYRKMIFVTN